MQIFQISMPGMSHTVARMHQFPNYHHYHSFRLRRMSSKSSQEETPSKLEPDYVIACTSNNPFVRLVNRTIHLLDTTIEVYMVIYWVSCWKMDLFWYYIILTFLFSVQTVMPVYLPSKVPYPCGWGLRLPTVRTRLMFTVVPVYGYGAQP